MFGGGPKFGGVEREYLSQERESVGASRPAGPTSQELESAEARIVAEVQERALAHRDTPQEGRSPERSSESPRVLDVKVGAPEAAPSDSLVTKLKERLSGKRLIEKILAIRNDREALPGRGEDTSREDLPLNLRPEQPPLPPREERATPTDDREPVEDRLIDREFDPSATQPIPVVKLSSGDTQPVPVVRREQKTSEPERAKTPEERREELEAALEDRRRGYVAAEKEWTELSKKWRKGMNFSDMSSLRPEAIVRRELAQAEYRNAKEAIVDHLWAEKKGGFALRFGKAWEEMSADERTEADRELAEFKVREIFPRFIIGEAESLNQLKLEYYAPAEEGAIRRTLRAGLNSYLRLSPAKRLLFSTAVVGGVVAATGGIGSIGGAALWGVQRVVRGAASVAAAEKVGRLVERRELAAFKTEEKKTAAMEGLRQEFSVSDLDSAAKKYEEITAAEMADRRRALIASAAAKLATGAGLNILGGYLAHGLEAPASRPRINIVGRVPETGPKTVPAPEATPAPRGVASPELASSPKPSPAPEVAPKPSPEILRPAHGIKLSVHEELSTEKPPEYLAREVASDTKPAEGWRLDFTKPIEAEPPLGGRGPLLTHEQMQEKFGELATVHEGEGAWQAVHRQLELRLQLHPEKFGLKPEDIGDGEKIERILNAKTVAILQKEGFIAPDGSTRIGIRAGDFRVRLGDDDHLTIEKAGLPAREAGTYDFQKVHDAPKVAPESPTEAVPQAETVPAASEQAVAVEHAPEEPLTPESSSGPEAELAVPSESSPSPESFIVRVPEHFTFREMISSEVQRHYAEAFSSLDEEGREDLLRILERHAAAHPELVSGTKLADVRPGDTLDFKGLLGNESFFEAKLDEVRATMLERIVSPRELDTLSDLGFTGEDFFSGKALGIIREMKVADFLEHFRNGQGGIDHGQLNHQLRLVGPGGETETIMLRGRHVKLAELLQKLDLDEETAHTKTVSAVLRAVERAA